MKKILVTSLLLLIYAFAKAQIFEPFTFRYQYTPSVGVSSTDFEGFENAERTEQHQLEFAFRYPITFGKRNAIILPELSHKTIGQNFDNWGTAVEEPATGNITRLFIKGVFPINDKWNILGVAAISQGVNSGVDWDFGNSYYRFGGGFLINNSVGNQIGATVQFIEEIGFPAPAFVFIGTTGEGKWNYNITFPLLSTIEYNLNESWRLRFEQRFDNDRFVLNNDNDTNYNQTLLNLSVGMSYKVAKPIFINLQAGITPLNLLTYYEDRNTSIDSVNFEIQPTFGASLYISVNPKDYIND